MSQVIELVRIDENGKLLERSNINFADIVHALRHEIKDYKDKYPLLSYVDPYGNTYINILQRPDFVEELKRFNLVHAFTCMEELITFINKTDIHQYIEFLGD